MVRILGRPKMNLPPVAENQRCDRGQVFHVSGDADMLPTSR